MSVIFDNIASSFECQFNKNSILYSYFLAFLVMPVMPLHCFPIFSLYVHIIQHKGWGSDISMEIRYIFLLLRTDRPKFMKEWKQFFPHKRQNNVRTTQKYKLAKKELHQKAPAKI